MSSDNVISWGREVAAPVVARRLRALAEELGAEPGGDAAAATLHHAFLAAARALETSADPPPRHQLLALVEVLTAGLESLLGSRIATGQGAND